MSFFADIKDDLSQEAVEVKKGEKRPVKSHTSMEDAAKEMSSQLLDEIFQNMEETDVPDVVLPEDIPAEMGDAQTEYNQVNESIESEIKETTETIPENAGDAVVKSKTQNNSPAEEQFAEDASDTLDKNKAVSSPTRVRSTRKRKTLPKMSDLAARTASEENAIITAGMTIRGNIISEGSLNIVGMVKGNIDVWGKLVISGKADGDIQANEIYVEGAKITGELVSPGAVKIGSNSVILGNILAKSAVIAGAVKGDIDVQGPVVLDSTAIVVGNIKSKSVQINNGAVIEGVCSQCYADINLTDIFSK